MEYIPLVRTGTQPRELEGQQIVESFEKTTGKFYGSDGVASQNGLWMSQTGRNLTDALDGILNGKRYLIHDRDPLFTTKFLDILAAVGVKSLKLPPRSPNLNAHAERFVRTIKEMNDQIDSWSVLSAYARNPSRILEELSIISRHLLQLGHDSYMFT